MSKPIDVYEVGTDEWTRCAEKYVDTNLGKVID